jgi:hypothetical protein
MLSKLSRLLALLCLLFAFGSSQAQISGPVRGVTFFHLHDESYSAQTPRDFPWVLDNQHVPAVRAQIDALLTQYRNAGVNWIRILVAANHFTPSHIYPEPKQELIDKVNAFMDITRSGANAGRFTIELVLLPMQDSAGFFVDQAPYNTDKAWYNTWLQKLNFSNLGMVMFGGDLVPCGWSPAGWRCQGEAGATDLQNKHGEWIRAIWAWKQSNYPTLNASYEVIGVHGASNNSTVPIQKMANWINLWTPSVPVVAASLYITRTGTTAWTWQQYKDATLAVLDAYHAVSTKPLWIDEFGFRAAGDPDSGVTTPEPVMTEQEQQAGYQGFLAASVCWRQNRYPKFAWEAGSDYKHGAPWGLFKGFSGTTPIARPAASEVALYYTLQSCP